MSLDEETEYVPKVWNHDMNIMSWGQSLLEWGRKPSRSWVPRAEVRVLAVDVPSCKRKGKTVTDVWVSCDTQWCRWAKYMIKWNRVYTLVKKSVSEVNHGSCQSFIFLTSHYPYLRNIKRKMGIPIIQALSPYPFLSYTLQTHIYIDNSSIIFLF